MQRQSISQVRRQSKIQHRHNTRCFANHQIRRLNVPMHQTLQMSIISCLCHGTQDLQHGRQRQSLSIRIHRTQVPAERHSADVLHHLKHPESGIMPQIIQGTDVLVIQPLHAAVRPLELFHPVLRPPQLRQQEFQDHFPARCSSRRCGSTASHASPMPPTPSCRCRINRPTC